MSKLNKSTAKKNSTPIKDAIDDGDDLDQLIDKLEAELSDKKKKIKENEAKKKDIKWDETPQFYTNIRHKYLETVQNKYIEPDNHINANNHGDIPKLNNNSINPINDNYYASCDRHLEKVGILNVGDKVKIAYKYPTKDCMWTRTMDKFLGTVAVLNSVNVVSGTVSLTLINGQSYTYSLLCIDKCYNSNSKASKQLTLNIDNVIYKVESTYPISFLEKYVLDIDFEPLRKIYEGEEFFFINEDLFNKIKDECPRVIGVLLSRGFLSKHG
jgi:hypothetical protein